MLCHGKAICGKKNNGGRSTDGNDSEGEDMYGFLPKVPQPSATKCGIRRCENIYGPSPRRRRRSADGKPKSVTFVDEPPRVRLIQRRYSCADNYREYAAARYAPATMDAAPGPSSYHCRAPVQRSHSFVASPDRAFYGACHDTPSIARPPPPCYQVAVRRAASFSASRGMNRIGGCPRRPQFERPVAVTATTPLNRVQSSSTSELYVDSIALKKNLQRQETTTTRCIKEPLSTASSTSSVSDATVYRKIPGPSDYYVSVNENKPRTKSFRISQASSTDDGVDVSFQSSTDLNLPRTNADQFSMANGEEGRDGDIDTILGKLCALESKYKDGTPNSSPRNSTIDMGAASPDNDSAFSDSVSLLSSESSNSTNSTTPTIHRDKVSISGDGDEKTEKVELALRKTKEAEVKKLFVKFFDKDGGSKSLLVDETTKCDYAVKRLATKNCIVVSPRWCIVEHLPELYLERVYEEHESLGDNLRQWTRDSKNKLFFVERAERLLLFERPEIYHPEFAKNSVSTVEDKSLQNALINEYLNNGGLPTVEGPLYIKVDSKKEWKKYHFVLRPSGLYYNNEKNSKSKDMACLITIDVNQLYYGIGWKKKFKAPTEHCFAIKHPSIQHAKSTKYIKYLCADDAFTLQKWITAIRIVKYGRQLLDNYQSMTVAVDECQLSDSGSSGCDVAFESDSLGSGTIKRKPPKLPLTATTRQLASLDHCSGIVDSPVTTVTTTTTTLERVPSFSSLPPPPPELLASNLTLDDDFLIDVPPPPPPPRLLQPPSQTFVLDLQRVMQRKWQISERCKRDETTTPHQVLGFRDAVLDNYHRETNVSNWLAEHYGDSGKGGNDHTDYPSLYENIYRKTDAAEKRVTSVVTPTNALAASSASPQRCAVAPLQSSFAANNPTRKRRPPPPPPPRAETTQLTTRSIRCQ